MINNTHHRTKTNNSATVYSILYLTAASLVSAPTLDDAILQEVKYR